MKTLFGKAEIDKTSLNRPQCDFESPVLDIQIIGIFLWNFLSLENRGKKLYRRYNFNLK